MTGERREERARRAELVSLGRVEEENSENGVTRNLSWVST
jgi:hypothetical protein